MSKQRHVLGLSGGKDSASLAVYIAQTRPELDVEYFFTDTGKELPEVYEYLGRLEGFLGKPIARLNPDRDFDFWLKQYKSFLPSPRTRWCTRQLKIRPFEQWLWPALDAGDEIVSYVAIRADENYRDGYTSTHPNLSVALPFREDGVDKAAVIDILEASGLGLPEYYQWRSRRAAPSASSSRRSSGFVSWSVIRIASKKRNRMRRTLSIMGLPFTWSAGESLVELSKPERVARIRSEHEKAGGAGQGTPGPQSASGG